MRRNSPQVLKAKRSRPQRINKLAGKVARHYERIRESGGARKKPMKRRDSKFKLRGMVAYDLETTSIKAGTPKPLYITAFAPGFQISQRLDSDDSLLNVLRNQLLIPENNRARFVAWNGNGYDVFFIARALLMDDTYVLRPYLTKSKSLRGLKVTLADDKKTYWEFLDGISMTGIVGRKLEFFLKTFAPKYQKLDAPDWENETFNADNKKHVEYADRDSEGLYYAMEAAQQITIENVGIPLQPTIGNLGIKAFMRHMPPDLHVWTPPLTVVDIIRKQAMRGGYCHCVRRYHGPIWKYDLNQAYAAAMREALLPCGSIVKTANGVHPDMPGIVRISAKHSSNKIPFYYRNAENLAVFGTDEITDTWITTLELRQLYTEKWKIKVIESYVWTESFSMTDYVNKLERTRINAPDGVNGATGLMIKAIGNNSYGKTVETLDGMELIMALEKPDGFNEYQSETDELQFCWFRFNAPVPREYHQPQIGAIITAHVRMVVRRAALLNPDAWLYADTDCVVFSEPVDLNPHPKFYGRWKQETNGEIYRIIEKKVYADQDAGIRHAKGMNVNRLTPDDFVNWFNGKPPTQKQLHRNNFIKFVTGSEMFHNHTKVGQRVNT